MDENEMRLASVELLLIEVLANLEPEVLADARRSILEPVDRVDSEQRDIRLGAAALIEDAQKRWAPPDEGLFIPGDG